MPDSVLDAIPDVAGLRAVRAKVHAEASPVCSSCGRHHLLDGHCSGATVVVHDVDDPQPSGDHGESADAHADAPHDLTTATRRDASERALRARRLLRSAIAYLGLDPASFGAVDDDARGAAVDTNGQGWLGPEIGPPLPRVQRIVAFLGIDVDPVEVTASELNEPAIATPPTDPSPTASDEDEAEPEQNDTAEAEAEYEPEPEESDTAEPEADNLAEDEMPPVEPIAVAESPTDVDVDADAEETPVDAVPDEATRHYWRRSDDDILYRPSRRPRSPRRAWRDRITSRG